MFTEFISTGGAVNDTIKNLKKWMKPQSRHIDMTMFPGASNKVIPQPLGVVGLIVPWNFPVFLRCLRLPARSLPVIALW